jgi:CheY-like chemotaxis protein
VTLVLRARDVMPGGGRIEIATREVTGEEVERRGVVEGVGPEYALLTLRDSGPGLAPDETDRLFEPYSEAGAGSGGRLGLSAVYGIVRQCGGFVFGETGGEGGTTFSIYLPLPAAEHPEDPTAAESPAPEGAPHEGPWTVLLVEDEDLIRSLAEQILEESGLKVVSAANASEAVELAASLEGPIDLLLTDIVMPGASGSDLAQLLLRQHAEMKVLYMSGYSDSLIFRYGVLQERSAFLQKPFSAEILERKVRELLES